MILKPGIQDVRVIGYYLGKIIVGLALAMVLPLCLGLLLREGNPCLDYLIGIEVALISGLVLQRVCHTDADLNWMDGMIVVALAWVVAMIFCAIPLWLSGHWLSFLDVCFETMSGLTTTGMSLVQDLDHMSYAHNFWRHMTMFIGGQGIVIIAISLFMKGASGAFRMYVGEGRDEKILPNVIHTSRFIWLVSGIFLVLGTLALAGVGALGGQRPFNAFFHGICMFMAAFDTGGFVPQSHNILYYHSGLYESITAILMILGVMNFRLHYHLWTNHPREIMRNIESRALFISFLLTFLLVAAGFWRSGMYPEATVMFRKGFYQLVSGHTTTGFQTVPAAQLFSVWKDLSLMGLMCAMALGGTSCSTTGAIKMIRIGIIVKAVVQDIKKIVLPERAIVIKKFHHIRDIMLNDAMARAAMSITLAYILLYCLGAIVGMVYGYPFLSALFESTSAAANIGLSCGITQPSMPAGLKATYMVQMWAGRLEFMSVLTLAGFLVAAVRGK